MRACGSVDRQTFGFQNHLGEVYGIIGSKIRENKILTVARQDSRLKTYGATSQLECRGISYRKEFNNAVRRV